MRWLIIFILFVVLLATSYIGYLWVTYIDNSVTSGSAYGFVIGEGKERVYHRVPEVLAELERAEGKAFIEVTLGPQAAMVFGVSPGARVMVSAMMYDSAIEDFLSKERWTFYFGGSYFNKITLRFCGYELCEIYRHRKKFELP